MRRVIGRRLGLVAATVLLGTVGACDSLGPPDDGPTGSPTASVTVSAAPATTTPATASADPTTSSTSGPTGAVASASAFPTTAPAYAEAVLRAWGYQQPTLAALAAPAALAQFDAVTVVVNQNWTDGGCQEIAASSYCRFTNANGDVITLRITIAALGRPQAAAEVALDLTTYPTSATEYVKGFIEAWRGGNTARMQVLATVPEATYFATLTPPASYQACAVTGAAVATVRVSDPTSSAYNLLVTVAQLGQAHAITGHNGVLVTCSP